MAVAGTQLTQQTGASLVSPSITPTANNLVLIALAIFKSGTMPTINSVTGNGITYTQIATAASIDDGFGAYKVFLFRGLAASPSAGAVTVSITGTADQVDFSISQFSGVDTTGTNGSGAVVQSVTGVVDEGNGGFSLTLAAFGSVNNGAYGSMIIYDDIPITPDTGWTELDDVTQIETQWRATNDTSVGWTWSGLHDAAGIAIELKAAAGGTDATVTAVVLDGTGDVPAPVVTGGTSGTVVAPPLDSTGDLVTPTRSANSTVTSPVLDGTGNVPDLPISVEAVVVPADATGDVPAPTVTTGQFVSAPPLDGVGDLRNPAVAAHATVSAPPLDGTGDLPTSLVAGNGPDAPVVCGLTDVLGTTRSSDVIGTTRSSDVIGAVYSKDVIGDTRTTDVGGSIRESNIIGSTRTTDVIGPTRTTTIEDPC